VYINIRKANKMRFEKLSDGEIFTRYIVCMEPYRYIEYLNKNPDEIFYWNGITRKYIGSSGIRIYNGNIYVNNCLLSDSDSDSDSDCPSTDEDDVDLDISDANGSVLP